MNRLAPLVSLGFVLAAWGCGAGSGDEPIELDGTTSSAQPSTGGSPDGDESSDSSSNANSATTSGSTSLASSTGDLAQPCALLESPSDVQAQGQGHSMQAVTFTASFSSGSMQWQRRLGCGDAQWQDIQGATEQALVLDSPDWVAVRSEYRAVCEDGTSTDAAVIVEPVLTGLSPADFGAVGDGVVNDVEALNATAAAAAERGTGVDLGGGAYRIEGYWVITNGVTALFNGTILPSGASTGIHLRGRTYGFEDNVSDLLIKDVVIDLAGAGADGYGIRGNSATRVAVVDSSVLNNDNLGSSLQFRVFAAGEAPVEDLVILGNVLTGAVATTDTEYESLRIGAESDLLPGYASVTEQWLAIHEIPGPIFENRGGKILCNDIAGGYYGVGLTHVTDFEIAHNHVRDNVRNISMQRASSRVSLHHNLLENAASTGIHLAMGSSNNEVFDNTINSARLANTVMQAYIDTDDNHFHDNVAVVSSETARAFVQISIHADGNIVDNNTFEGPIVRALVLHEPSWDSTNDHFPHRGAWAGPVTNGYAADDSVGNIFTDNVFVSESDAEHMCSPSAITDATGTWSILGLEDSGNTVNGVPWEPHIYVDP